MLTGPQGGVGYYLYQEVFSPDSKVAYYNRAVDRIRKDPRCLELLGQGNEIKAFGQETNSAWRRARPIACVLARDSKAAAVVEVNIAHRSTLSSDGSGTEHLRIQFNVSTAALVMWKLALCHLTAPRCKDRKGLVR